MNTKNLKSFDMNKKVAVKLSKQGHKHLEKYFGQNEDTKYYLEHFIKMDGDVLEIELWKLMQIFGSEMSMGNNATMPFASMDMLISDDDLEEVRKPQKEHEDEER